MVDLPFYTQNTCFDLAQQWDRFWYVRSWRSSCGKIWTISTSKQFPNLYQNRLNASMTCHVLVRISRFLKKKSVRSAFSPRSRSMFAGRNDQLHFSAISGIWGSLKESNTHPNISHAKPQPIIQTQRWISDGSNLSLFDLSLAPHLMHSDVDVDEHSIRTANFSLKLITTRQK